MKTVTRMMLVLGVAFFLPVYGISRGEARTLTTVLREGFDLIPQDPLAITNLVFPSSPRQELDLFAFSKAGQGLSPVLSAAVANAVTQQAPLASVAPSFTYRYNASLNLHERSTGVPGPLFSERAPTIGKGQLNFGIGYSYVDLDDINGLGLHDPRTPLLLEAFCPSSRTGGPVFTDPLCNQQLSDGTRINLLALGLSSVRTRLDIQAHLVVPTVRYGLTDNWDVGLSIPLINTFLRVRHDLIPVVSTADAFLATIIDPQGNTNSALINRQGQQIDPSAILGARFGTINRATRTLTKVAGSSTGVGDITLRTKYHLWGEGQGGAAVGLELRLPSGEKKNFQGTGETHVSPFLYVSQVMWDRIEPHVNVGLDFNTKDVDRSAFLYAVGVTALVWKQLGAGIDIIGRSDFGRFQPNQSSNLLGLKLDRPITNCSGANTCGIGSATPFRFPFRIKRNDVIDISFGLRYTLGTSGSVFFGTILPLNDDGFRADFIPSGGLEYTF